MGREKFLKDIEIAKEQFAFIDYEYREGKKYPYKVTDDFEIIDNEGNHWGTFRASVYFTKSYPRGIPIMQDESKAFPWEVDWHISPKDGECCVCGVIEQEELARKGISIKDFINNYTKPFYANQVYRKEYGCYKNGEYAHYEEGVWESLEEEFNTKDRVKIRRFFVEMKTKRGRNEACFCGSGIKYKKCHLQRINIIEGVFKKRILKINS